MNSRLKHIQNWESLAQKADWSVGKLAQICEVSIRSLQQYFQQEWQVAPKKWLIEQRQKSAMELLFRGASIKETAACLGYKYSHHFSREFRKHHGICPMQCVREWETANLASSRHFIG